MTYSDPANLIDSKLFAVPNNVMWSANHITTATKHKSYGSLITEALPPPAGQERCTLEVFVIIYFRQTDDRASRPILFHILWCLYTLHRTSSASSLYYCSKLILRGTLLHIHTVWWNRAYFWMNRNSEFRLFVVINCERLSTTLS